MPKYLYIKTKKFPTTEEPNIPYIKFKKDNIITLANLGQIERFSSMDQLTDDISGIIIHKNNEYIVINSADAKKLFDLHYYARDHVHYRYDNENYEEVYELLEDNINELTNIKPLPDASFAFSGGYAAGLKEEIPQEIIDSWDMSQVTSLESFFGGKYVERIHDDATEEEDGYSGKNIDISKWNTKNVETMENMFHNCYNLETVNMPTCSMSKLKSIKGIFNNTCIKELPLFDTSNVEDMSMAFMESQSFIDVPLYDTKNVNKMNDTFAWTFIITVPQFNLENLEEADRMFYRCNYLTSIPQFNTPKLKNTSAMFMECEELTSNGLTLFNTSNVKDMDQMFYLCKKLDTIPYFDTSKVERMWGIFYCCEKLTHIPALNTGNVKEMTKAFYGCSSLTNDGLPELNTSNVEKMYMTFSYCKNLTEKPSLTSTANVVDMGEMFRGTGLVNVSLSDYNTEKVENMTNMFANCKNLRRAINLKLTNCRNAAGMFAECPNLTDVEIAPSTTTNLLCTSSMFSESGISAVPQFNTSNVVNMRNMFYKCTSLDTLYAQMNTHTARDMVSMFEGCTKLPNTFPYPIDCYSIVKETDIKNMFKNTPVTEVTLTRVHNSIKDKITSNLLKGNNTLKINFTDINEFHRTIRILRDKEKITDIYDSNYYNSSYFSDHLDFLGIKDISNMFWNLSNLIEPPVFENTEEIENIYATFYNCSKLERLPDIESSNIKHLGYTFYGCSSLVTIPEIDTSKCSDFSSMCAKCTSLPETFPWTIDLSSIEYYDDYDPWYIDGMFYGSSVTNVTFKNVPIAAKDYLTSENLKYDESLNITVLNYI